MKKSILTQKQGDKIYEHCQELYQNKTQGIQAIIDYCDKFKLPYGFCKPCEADFPIIETADYRICAVCGSAIN